MQHRAAQGNPSLINKMADDNTAEKHATNPKPTPRIFTLPIHKPTTATSASMLTVNAISLMMAPCE
jgi:hypothetical protein